MNGGPPGWDLGRLPAFYGERVADLIAREGRSFNDPALGLGIGARFRLGARWSLRQDARTQLVIRNGEVYPVWAFTIQFGHSL